VTNKEGEIWVESKFGKGSQFYFTISEMEEAVESTCCSLGFYF